MASVKHLSYRYTTADEIRFWDLVDVRGPDECWPWTASTSGVSGYGKFSLNGESVGAHKFAFICTYGPLPASKPIVDHLCHHHTGCERRNCAHILCCNPRHLGARTQSDNINSSDTHLAAINARKTHCPQGHSYAEHGFRNNRGQRQCRICVNARRAAKYVPKSDRRRTSQWAVTQTQADDTDERRAR